MYAKFALNSYPDLRQLEYTDHKNSKHNFPFPNWKNCQIDWNA